MVEREREGLIYLELIKICLSAENFNIRYRELKRRKRRRIYLDSFLTYRHSERHEMPQVYCMK